MKKKFIIILIYSLLFLYGNKKDEKDCFRLNISKKFWRINKKFWVGEKYKIILENSQLDKNKTIFLKNSDSNKTELWNGFLIMKSRGKDCLTVFSKEKNSTSCFKIYNTPELNFLNNEPITLEINKTKKLYLNTNNYPLSNIKFKSDSPEIIKVTNEGKITALKPGYAKIIASGLDNISTKINVKCFSKKGLINENLLEFYNISQYKKLMIVAHPDDETLWGGANLIKDKYFVVCITNGYHSERASDFKEILKFTNNSGIILNYPDILANVIDDWSDVKQGILKDLSLILNFQNWSKIVTHGLEGTTGHIHHVKISKYVTKIAKKYNKYNILYYFGKYYDKDRIPKNLPRINESEYEYKKKEVELHKHEKNCIYARLFHMLPYENWILASNWKKK